jgi:hypothetical protein
MLSFTKFALLSAVIGAQASFALVLPRGSGQYNFDVWSQQQQMFAPNGGFSPGSAQTYVV